PASTATRSPSWTGCGPSSSWTRSSRKNSGFLPDCGLAQVAVEDKGNETTAIPEVLRLLDLHGALVSIDAIGCQKAIAQQIREAGGDYLLAVKDNQPTLHADIQAAFDKALAVDLEGVRHDLFVTEETGHGRYEERIYVVLYEPEGLSTAGEWGGVEGGGEGWRTRGGGGGGGWARGRGGGGGGQGGGTLHQQQHRLCRPPGGGNSDALEHRERTALVPGRLVRRGSLPEPPGQRGREPGLAAEDGVVAAPP